MAYNECEHPGKDRYAMPEQNKTSKREIALKNYLAQLPQNIHKIEEMWSHLRHVQWNPQVLTSLKHLTHKLLGGALTLHLHKIAYDLKALDYNLHQMDDDSPAPKVQDSLLIEENVNKLKSSLDEEKYFESTVDPASLADLLAHDQDGKAEKIIYLVDDDQVIHDILGSQLEASGYKVKSFTKLSMLYESLKTETPNLLILDIVFPGEGALAGVDALKNLRMKTGFQIPVIFISARSDMVARLRCLRAGGNAFFSKPVDIKSLLVKIEELTPKEHSQYRALIIDDDDISLDIHGNALQSANFLVKKVSNPLNAVKEIHQYHPDVLLLDLMMPMCNGFELADLLRQDDHFATLPIIFLTGDNSDKTRQQAEQVDNSQYLTKPVEAATLLGHSLKAARQYRIFRSKTKLAIRAAHESLVERRHVFIDKLDRIINGQSDRLAGCQLMYLLLDNLDAIRQHFGLRKLDEINERLFSNLLPFLSHDDMATAITDGALLVLYHADFGKGLATAKAIKNKFSQLNFAEGEPGLSAHVSIGLFSLDTPIANSIDSVAYAESAVNQAHESGGNKVVAVVNQESKSLEKSQQLILSEKLEAAIRDKDYVLNFQCILHLDDPSFDAYEVLVRLQDDMGRELSPSRFLETVRRLDAVIEMDRWIYSATTAAIHKDQAHLMSAQMFLKVSLQTLGYNLLPTIVNGLINASRILSERQLVFLLDHQCVEKNIDRARQFSEAMRKIKCELAIENFQFDLSTHFIEEIQPAYLKINVSDIMESYQNDIQRRL